MPTPFIYEDSDSESEDDVQEPIYCRHYRCEENCSMSRVCKIIEFTVLRETDFLNVADADRDQSFLARFLKTRREGYASQFFRTEVSVIADILKHLQVNTIQSSVMMKFVYLTVMKKFQDSKDEQLSLYNHEICRRQYIAPNDNILAVLKNPQYGFRSLLVHTLIHTENNIQNFQTLRRHSFGFQEFLENRAVEIERSNEHLGPLYDFMSLAEQIRLRNGSSFFMRTFRLYLNKVDYFLLLNDSIIGSNLLKLYKMRAFHFAILQNWDDMTQIPKYYHPSRFVDVLQNP